jgi:phospholipase C
MQTSSRKLRWIAGSLLALGALAAPASLYGQAPATTTPIQHVVVIFQENVSFDHYFATYPVTLNSNLAEPGFTAAPNTPSVNGLNTPLLMANPNSAAPFRLTRAQAVTCDQDHSYGDEQKAFDGGLMDKFVESVGSSSASCDIAGLGKKIVMGYYDGNTVTAMWNYAQFFAMSDNSWGTGFGPSTPGALNLVSGNTFAGTLAPTRPNGNPSSPAGNIAGAQTTGSVVGDPRPLLDDCVASNPKFQNVNQITMSGKNVGDLLNAKGITWGWFQGGFAPTGVDAQGRAVCGQHNTGLAGDDAIVNAGDYIPHHEPFMYYPQTTNPHHTRPSDAKLIGTSKDGANHQYDLTDFFTALNLGHLPAVSYLKAGAYQDGHAAYSSPIDEQIFVVNVINALMQSNEWKETAVIIAWDDSDGWYDHQMGTIVTQSNAPDDELLGPGNCGAPKANDVSGGTQNGRCGFGPRLPLLVVSPWAKQNFIDDSITDQSSILVFIEDNFNLGRLGGGSTDAIAGRLNNMFDFDDAPRLHRVILDPTTGVVVHQ